MNFVCIIDELYLSEALSPTLLLFDHLVYFQISDEISNKQSLLNYGKNGHLVIKSDSRIQRNAVNI